MSPATPNATTVAQACQRWPSPRVWYVFGVFSVVGAMLSRDRGRGKACLCLPQHMPTPACGG